MDGVNIINDERNMIGSNISRCRLMDNRPPWRRIVLEDLDKLPVPKREFHDAQADVLKSHNSLELLSLELLVKSHRQAKKVAVKVN
jgi:hypothetical protein